MDRQPAPALLPILRSQQQGEILALLLGDPDLELSLTEIAARTGAPHPSVYREIQRAEQADRVSGDEDAFWDALKERGPRVSVELMGEDFDFDDAQEMRSRLPWLSARYLGSTRRN